MASTSSTPKQTSSPQTPVDKKKEQRILITQAQAGMLLARPILNASQVVICGAGMSLNEHIIHQLAIRGVKRIYVQGQPLPEPGQKPFGERLAELEQRFSRVHRSLLMRHLHQAIKDEMSKRS